MNNDIFEDLFVLELANNHWGDVERGLKIINTFGQVVRFNNVRAAIKLQFRDVDSFVHPEWRAATDIRYIKKTLDTKLEKEQLRVLVEAVRKTGCLTCATPFDEASVDLCREFNVDIIKIASSDINDWFLIEKIATTGKPVLFSTGGSEMKSIDDIVRFFARRRIPLAVNHCVSIYPSEDHELELNQIDFLRDRYPDLTIGFSSHEYRDWRTSIQMAYAKGARTFERHIDIDDGGIPVSPYCSLPEQCDEWFKAFHKAREMAGGSTTQRRSLPDKEVRYLDALVRGVYLKSDLPAGHVLGVDDVYLAIPLQEGQLSPREFMSGEVLAHPVKKDAPLSITDIDSPYAQIPSLKALIADRGVEPRKPDPDPLAEWTLRVPEPSPSVDGAGIAG
jgi:sialic acid synthase SpsE